ncbi:hypothetical protein ACIRU8_19185 [Streptomyces sp. NPDC101175]|uniref:hypothetical protein n=1 Tax=Streptomyces sp. NPDC101175 TaxID=3366123 RepID=UPI00383293D0
MLGLLGFYSELGNGPDRLTGGPSGSIRDAVRPVAEPDEAELVAYLDGGHVLLDVMESAPDVITGRPHRHSPGCSSLMTDGSWLWRRDFPHYVETHHVALPEAFVAHVRALRHQMPTIDVAGFASHYDETVPLVGWSSLVPWRSAAATLVVEPRTVMSKAEFDAATVTEARERPSGKWNRPRKQRKPPRT